MLKQRLGLTALEDRTVPALFGVTWPDPQHLTVSFAPDGTDVGGVTNDLAAELDAEVGKGVWRGEILRAFQTWAVATNVNVRVVSDAGIPFGADAQLQACSRVGDIRIASRPLSNSQLAVSNPPDLVSGWAGEIVLNSNYRFSAGGANGTPDLYSVMLHEIGHSLGLSSNYALDKSAAMYESYVGPRTGLSPADVAAIQELYSAREADAYEGKKGNDTARTSTYFEYLATLSQANSNYVGGGVSPYVVRADLTTASDVDRYRVQLPKSVLFPVLSLNTSRVSQLAAKVSVLDGQGKVLLTASAEPGQDIRLDLRSLPPNTLYHVQVEANRADVFGVGGYRLTVGNALAVAASGLFTTRFSTGGETLETNHKVSGVQFTKVTDNQDARWDAVGATQLASASDAHTITVNTTDTANALVVAVWAAGDISPTLRVTDNSGNDVPFQVLRADGYATVIQILGVKAKSGYHFRLTAGDWQHPSWLGAVGYRFAADLRDQPISLATFADGTLTAAAPTAAREFVVAQSQLFRFELTAGSLLAQPDATATLTITDRAGQEVFRLSAAAGQTLASDVFLTPGTYAVRITGAVPTGTLSPLGVLGRMAALTDPIGPTLLDPTAPLSSPSSEPPPSDPPPSEPPPTEPTTVETTVYPTADTGFFWGVFLVDPFKLGW